MLRSQGNSLQTHPRASRSGAEGSKGLGGKDRDTLLFLQLLFLVLLFPSFFSVPLSFIFSFGLYNFLYRFVLNYNNNKIIIHYT